jgi:hypothetical protein
MPVRRETSSVIVSSRFFDMTLRFVRRIMRHLPAPEKAVGCDAMAAFLGEYFWATIKVGGQHG